MDIYQALENKYNPMGLTIGTYDTPVNFNESLRTPIHRWYGYKEGFSPSFVNEFVSKYSRSLEDIIFDPFGGVGTTGLEANKMGYNAYLMDVNPLGIFASTVKTRHYSDIEVDHFVNIIRKSKFPQNPKRSVRFSGKGTKRSVQKRKARNTQKAETKVL